MALTYRLLFLLLLYFLVLSLGSAPRFASSAALDTMELKSFLTPSSNPLFSSSSAFMLSFNSPSSFSSTTNLYLSVSFVVKGSAGHPAWTANRDNAVSVNASLTLSSAGNLVLTDSSSEIWKSNTAGLGVVRAQLLDTGNFVLLNSTSGYVWQSFQHPTDTLLPGQDFSDKSSNLISNRRSNDLSSGKYSLGFTPNGALQLFHTTTYWSGWDTNSSFQFNQLGSLTPYNSPSSINSTIITSDYGVSATRRITLDIDGNLRMYTWDDDSVQWSSVWMAFTDVCTRVKGLCGRYAVCIYNPTQPTCMCPQGFSVSDYTDLSAGCERNYIIDCSNSPKYIELENVDYPFNDYDPLGSMSIKECKDRCSKNCSCVAAAYWQSGPFGHCWLMQDLQNGYSPNSQQHRVFVKVSASDPSVSSPIIDVPAQWSSQNVWQPLSSNQSTITYVVKRGNKYFSTVIALAIVIAILLMCFAATAAALISRSRMQARYTKLHGEMIEGSPLVCSYEELRAATRNFSQKLGSGGFGTVYKGQLQNGKLVAVKQLEGVLQQEKQFRAEIRTIGRIHHINLLRLVGFCAEDTHRLLVYEYMEKGSLDQLLFEDSDKPDQIEVLDWSTRFQICLGVARGIHYLHEECLDCILHCDIKPQNILLDSNYCAKVADFGLAYLYTRDHTVKMTTIRGTRGYLAPEWVSNLPITSKADVYSYGMLVLEIISGRRNFLYTESAMLEPDERWCFPMWAYGKRVEEVVDPRLEAGSIDFKEAEAALKVGYACIQADLNARPSMGKVVQMLEGTLRIPGAPPPSLFPQDHAYPMNPSTTSSNSTSQAFSVLGTIARTSH
eukprot:c25327_g1_i3 orf=69-2570(+)